MLASDLWLLGLQLSSEKSLIQVCRFELPGQWTYFPLPVPFSWYGLALGYLQVSNAARQFLAVTALSGIDT